MDIMVYFNSGNKAKFDLSRVRFTDSPKAEDFAGGRTVVNWANVSFVREYQEPKEAEEE